MADPQAGSGTDPDELALLAKALRKVMTTTAYYI